MNLTTQKIEAIKKDPDLLKAINSLVEDLQPAVEKIEARPATTQSHYGEYLAILTKTSGGNRGMVMLLAVALVESGASLQGVNGALLQYG